MGAQGNIYGVLKTGLKVIALMITALVVAIVAHALIIIAINAYYTQAFGHTQQATDAINAMVGNIWVQAGMIILQNAFFVLVALLFLKIDRDQLTAERLGLKFSAGSPRQFLAGVGLDVVFFLAVFAVMLLAGVVTFTGFGPAMLGWEPVLLSFGLMLAATLTIGLGEEILFRGYLQGALTKKYGIALALPLASLAFVLVHVLPKLMINDLSLLYFLSILPVALTMGLLFYKTGTLWASIGFHFFEDFLALNVFFSGNPIVSGLYPLLVFSVPEEIRPLVGSWGDLIGFAVATALLAAVWLYYRRRPEAGYRQ